MKHLGEESRRQSELAHVQEQTLLAQAEAAREEAENIRLERRAHLQGWSAHGVNSYAVTLVTEPAEIDLARDQLASGSPLGRVRSGPRRTPVTCTSDPDQPRH